MAESVSELCGTLLQLLDDRGSIDSYEVAKELDKDHQLVVGAVKSLQALGNVGYATLSFIQLIVLLFNVQVINTDIRQIEQWQLTKEGTEIVEYGSHEARVFEATDKDKGILHSELMVLHLL